MQSTSPVNQTLFVNQQVQRVQQQGAVQAKTERTATNKIVVEGELLSVGDSESFAQAQDIFERANSFDKLPTRVQEGLQAYNAHALEQQRSAVKGMMGVDLFA